MNTSRTPAGVPTGGQFAQSAKNESEVSLSTDRPEVAKAIAEAKATLTAISDAVSGDHAADRELAAKNVIPGATAVGK